METSVATAPDVKLSVAEIRDQLVAYIYSRSEEELATVAKQFGVPLVESTSAAAAPEENQAVVDVSPAPNPSVATSTSDKPKTPRPGVFTDEEWIAEIKAGKAEIERGEFVTWETLERTVLSKFL